MGKIIYFDDPEDQDKILHKMIFKIMKYKLISEQHKDHQNKSQDQDHYHLCP